MNLKLLKANLLWIGLFATLISYSQIKTIISGNLPDSTIGINTVVMITKWDFSIPIDFRLAPADTVIVKDGKFKFELFNRRPIYIQLYASNNKEGYPYFGGYLTQNNAFGCFVNYYTTYGVLLEPGDSIHMDLRNGKNYLSTIFSGKGSEKLRCIQEIFRNTTLYRCPPTILDENKTQAIELIDSVNNMVLNTINIFRHKLTFQAVSILKAHYISMFGVDISKIVSDMDFHNLQVKKMYKVKLSKLKNIIDPADSSLLYDDYFDGILSHRALLEYAIENNVSYPKSAFKKEYFQALMKYIPNVPIKERIVTKYLLKEMGRIGITKDMEETIKIFLAQKTMRGAFYDSLEKRYNLFVSRLKPTSLAYKFLLPDTTGQFHKLDDFKGKVVLMDFMFLGCGGCAKMVPYLKKVEEKFKDEEVVFLSISLDKNINNWKQAIGTFSTSGSLQLFTSGEEVNHPIARYYDIPGGPYLVLIDKEGRLISARAPDPRKDDGKALISLINQHLAKKPGL